MRYTHNEKYDISIVMNKLKNKKQINYVSEVQTLKQNIEGKSETAIRKLSRVLLADGDDKLKQEIVLKLAEDCVEDIINMIIEIHDLGDFESGLIRKTVTKKIKEELYSIALVSSNINQNYLEDGLIIREKYPSTSVMGTSLKKLARELVGTKEDIELADILNKED